MDKVISALFGLAGLINFLPLMGVLGAKRLEAMYGVPVDRPDLALLLQHRAVLFGLVGGLMLWSVVDTGLRPAAAVVGMISMVSFIALALMSGPMSSHVTKIVIADVVGIVALGAALLLKYVR